jgi:hypothetical protein
MANICRSLRKTFFSSPVLKSPTHIGFIDVIKNGSKISHLGTFKGTFLTSLAGAAGAVSAAAMDLGGGVIFTGGIGITAAATYSDVIGFVQYLCLQGVYEQLKLPEEVQA